MQEPPKNTAIGGVKGVQKLTLKVSGRLRMYKIYIYIYIYVTSVKLEGWLPSYQNKHMFLYHRKSDGMVQKWDFTTDDRCMGEILCHLSQFNSVVRWDSWMYPYPPTPMGIHSINPIYWVFIPQEFPRKLSLEISGQFTYETTSRGRKQVPKP